MFGRHFQREPAPLSRHEISEVRFKQFLRDLNAYEREHAVTETRDAFLDVYSRWLKTREPWLKIRVVMLAFELHRLDPAFQFDLSFNT